MKPFYTFTDTERISLYTIFDAITASPYTGYPYFKYQVAKLIGKGMMPDFYLSLCQRICTDRASGKLVHVIKNCPIDREIPTLNHDHPIADKYSKKTTFISEVFLETFAALLETPLLSYKTRNNGDFFTDVVCINRFRGKRTGFTDGDLIYHNDRTSHPVRADFITLLGLRCPPDDLVYTTYIDGQEIIEHLVPGSITTLRQSWFVTEVDDLSRENNNNWDKSVLHPILLDDYTLRYQDTLTKPIHDAPVAVWDALIDFKDAIAKSTKTRHRIENGDLLVFANQQGLHNRERIEINNPDDIAKRWLLKTYTFRDVAAADTHRVHWVDGIYGCVCD